MKNLLKISLTLLIAIVMSVGVFKPEILMGTPASPAVGNWYQQFMPDIGSRTIQDITFVDSLTGYVSARQTGDTSYILKTMNGGNNWQIIYRNFFAMTQIQFLNSGTGYACGACLFKTINGGLNWNQVTAPSISPEEFVSINEDTIWIISSEPFSGGVFRTTNGGAAWEHQFSGGTQNPDHIYMYNGRLGFMSRNGASPNIYRTTNSGVNWDIVVSGQSFNCMQFIDSLTGWHAYGNNMYKTTNGGVNWITQVLPFGGLISSSSIMKSFSVINKDTIWGGGGYLNFGGGRNRGILYFTSNGGSNWYYQLPDTSYQIPQYDFVKFLNKRIGWAYETYFSQQIGGLISTGIHTTNGGDTGFILGIQQMSNNIPEHFRLFQNYPNPFNPVTNIGFRIVDFGFVTITVFDVTGKEITKLINTDLKAGEYNIDWNASGYSSGVYFYKLTVTAGREVFTDTKKMVLIK